MSINSQVKKSFSLMARRQKFKAQIRGEFLREMFAQKRKQMLIKDINCQQKQRLSHKVNQLVTSCLNCKSREQAQATIRQIYQQLSQDSANLQDYIKQNSQNLLKTFIMFPKSIDSIRILYMILHFCYEHTFQLDDKRFISIHNQGCFQVEIQKEHMTLVQQSVDVLFRTADEQVSKLTQRRTMDLCRAEHEFKEVLEWNYEIEKRVESYLVCLKELSINVNSFFLRYKYANMYVTRWSKLLLIEQDFGKQYLLLYLNALSRFIIPFPSYATQQKNVFKLVKNQIEDQTQQAIMNKLFELCIPDVQQQRSQKIPALSMMVLRNLLQFAQVKIGKMILHLDQIMRLIRIVLNFQRYFKLQGILRIFDLLIVVIKRFISQRKKEGVRQDVVKLHSSVNLVQVLKGMQFLQTFDLYFKTQFQNFCLPIYRIINCLIEYCIVFQLDLNCLLGQKDFLCQIVHKIDNQNIEVVRINLSSILLICEQSTRRKTKQHFIKMVRYGVDMSLEHLVYHKNEWIQQEATRIMQEFFTEDKLYQYTQLQSQLGRYDHQFQMPERQEVYQI